MFWDNTLLQLFEKGGGAMWPLLLCSILGVALILDRCFAFLWCYGSFESFCRRLKPLLAEQRLDEARQFLSWSRYPLARVVEVFLNNLGRSAAQRKELAEREGSIRLAVLENRLNWLGIIGQVSPMLGLLGTVTGLVAAFHQIEVRHGVVQPGDLAAGIWEALITTVFGLIIAIPCLTVFQLLDTRVAKLQAHMEWMISYLEEWCESGESEPVQEDWIGGQER